MNDDDAQLLEAADDTIAYFQEEMVRLKADIKEALDELEALCDGQVHSGYDKAREILKKHGRL